MISQVSEIEMDLSLIQIASVVYGAIREYRLSVEGIETPPWDALCLEVQNEVIHTVEAQIAAQEQALSISDRHHMWVHDRIQNGWVYGSRISNENKTHPHLLPYNDLPKSYLDRDRLIVSIIDALKK